MIRYLDERYGDRIYKIRTVTNGTIVPRDEFLERLKGLRFEVTVDDYREAVPQYAGTVLKLMDKLDEYGIQHYRNYTDQWIDLAPMKTDHSAWTEEQLMHHFDDCCQSWQELRDGKIFIVNYSACAAVAEHQSRPSRTSDPTDAAQGQDRRQKERLVGIQAAIPPRGM